MARTKTVRAPTTSSLPDSLRVPSTTPSLVKIFSKLSRPALLDLVLEWLDNRNAHLFLPYLERDQGGASDDDDEINPYPVAQTVDEVRSTYRDLRDRKGAKREVIDRVLDGDWRHGITLRQLAMVDMCHMEEHPSRLRWTALELTRIGLGKDGTSTTVGDRYGDGDLAGCFPRIHAVTFLKNLQREVSPLVKAHYYFARSASLPLIFLRIFVTDSPYQYPHQSAELFTDSSRVIYIAFPDSCPFIYTSLASSVVPKTTSSKMLDARSLRGIVADAIPKALSRPHERYTLEATALTAKSLPALLALRGPGRSNSSNGAFSIFADAVVEGSPLDPRPSNTVSPDEYYMNGQSITPSIYSGRKPRAMPDDSSSVGDGNHQLSKSTNKRNSRPAESNAYLDPVSKKRRLTVQSRFGTTGTLSSAPLDRLDIKMLDPPTSQENEGSESKTGNAFPQPTLTLTFAGTDVISGIRQLAELGIVDPERMPSWMTGEEGVSVASIRRGKRVVRDGG